jgi:hypothetical protein
VGEEGEAGENGAVVAAALGAGDVPVEAEAEDEEDEDEDDDAGEPAAGGVEKPGKACIAGHPGAATSNQTLLQWLPRCGTVEALWAATEADCTQPRANDNEALVRVAYQCRTDVTWGEDTRALAGRTLEEAFALENLTWCQDVARKSLQLRIPKSGDKDLTELVRRIHRRVQAKSFKKTDFALALLAEDPAQWTVPTYIANGLRWLENEIAPLRADGPAQGGAWNGGGAGGGGGGGEAPGDAASPEIAA